MIYRSSIFHRSRIALLACIACNAAIAGDPAQEIYARFAGSVVTISTYDATLYPHEQGSGIVIKAEEECTYILTNYHVVHRANLIHVDTKSGKRLAARLCYFDQPADMALLRTRSINCLVPQSAATVDIGSQAFAIGTPRGLGWTISNGIVSSIRKRENNELVQFTAAASPGSSGGPLLDANGALIGITSLKAQTGENLNFALRVAPAMRTELERHFWRGKDPSDIPEVEWCVGHSEQSDKWMESNERAKSWNAHTTVIKELETKLLGRSKSPRELHAENREFFDAARTGRRMELPGNVLAERIRHGYAERYDAFPDDKDGWESGAIQLEANRSGMEKLLREGLTKWPHSPDVLGYVFETMHTDSPSAVTKLIEATADSLPTKQAIMALKPIEEDTTVLPSSSERRQFGKSPIERLVEAVWLARVDFPDDHDWKERVALLKQTLVAKGWAYLVEESSSPQQNKR